VQALTKRQGKVLDLIRAYIAKHGYSPTLRELRDRMGTVSTNAVCGHLRALEKKGQIR